MHPRNPVFSKNRVSKLAQEQIAAQHERLVAIYRAAYTRPPYHKPDWEIADFAESVLNHTGREGLRFVGAWAREPAALVGFAYGFTGRPGQWWHDVVRAGMPAELAAVWLANPFQVAEMVVAPDFQEQGLGGRLHDALMRDLPHERAVLSTLQMETAAQRMYNRRGWRMLVGDFFFPGVERRYQILGRRLIM